MFNNKNPVIMKNVSQKTVSILIGCLLALLYAYVKTDKTDKKEVYDIKPKEIDIVKLNSYANEEDMELAIAYKNGFIERCEKFSKEAPTRIGNYLILKDVKITDQRITYSYQVEFEKSKISESKWNDFITNSKESTKSEIFSSAKEILAEYNISLSKVFELAEIKLEYIFFDTNDDLIATFQLDYIDFYGM